MVLNWTLVLNSNILISKSFQADRLDSNNNIVFSVKVKGTMSSETRREALTQLNTMEAEMKKATERMKEMEEEKEQARQKERNRQSISTPGSEVKTPRRTPARFGL